MKSTTSQEDVLPQHIELHKSMRTELDLTKLQLHRQHQNQRGKIKPKGGSITLRKDLEPFTVNG